MSTGKLLCAAVGARFNGVKVFSATMAEGRSALGDAITAWMRDHPRCRPTEFVITQSSDSRFHCLSIAVFYAER